MTLLLWYVCDSVPGPGGAAVADRAGQGRREDRAPPHQYVHTGRLQHNSTCPRFYLALGPDRLCCFSISKRRGSALVSDAHIRSWLVVVCVTAPYGTMTAADALVTLHQVDPEATKVPLKK